MNQRPQNDYLRVNKTGKYSRRSIFHQVHANANANAIPQSLQPQPKTQVYIIDKSDFKSIVQQLTSNQSCELLPQNVPNRQKVRPEPLNRTSSVPPNATPVPVSLHMRYIESLLEDSSESNEDQFQQPFDDYQSHMLAQPQVPYQPMPYSNGFDSAMTTAFPSPWFDSSPQQMDGGYLLQPTRAEYPQPLHPDFTFPYMTDQPRVFDPDLGHF